MENIQIGTMVMTKAAKNFNGTVIPGQVYGLVCDIHKLYEGNIFVELKGYEGVYEYKLDEVIVCTQNLF